MTQYYVAGKWQDREMVSVFMDELRKRGHEITEDWTVHSEKEDGWALKYSVADINGVCEASEYVGLFYEDYQYKGAIAELGAALALNTPCHIIGHRIDSCIFAHHPLVLHYDRERDFFERLDNE